MAGARSSLPPFDGNVKNSPQGAKIPVHGSATGIFRHFLPMAGVPAHQIARNCVPAGHSAMLANVNSLFQTHAVERVRTGFCVRSWHRPGIL